MQNIRSAPGLFIQKTWKFFQKIPKGSFLFSKMMGYIIPYTGSIKPHVIQLERGKAVVKLRDKRAVRNHLQSIHAIALANLGEFTTGLTLIPHLDPNSVAILTKLEVVYHKKARGTLISTANYSLPAIPVGDSQHLITANINNDKNELVCQVIATWQVRKRQD